MYQVLFLVIDLNAPTPDDVTKQLPTVQTVVGVDDMIISRLHERILVNPVAKR